MIKNNSIKIFGMIFLAVLMFGLVSAETNTSIMYGENSSGSIVPLQIDDDGQLKISLSFMNITVGSISATGNLSLGEKITFGFGEVIDNIVDGWVRVTGALNVTSGNFSLGGKLLSNEGGVLTWGGTEVTTNVSGDTTVNNYLNNGSDWVPMLASANGAQMIVLNNSAGGIGGGKWSQILADIYYTAGNVGIGTTSPNYLLEIASGTANAVNLSGIIYVNDNKVGIGTASPTEKLNIVGNAKVVGNANITGNLTLGAGQIWFNNSDAKYYYYNKTAWLEIGSGSGNVPENAVMSFNQASCPVGWQLADGTSGTPDLRGIFIRGAGTSGILQLANASKGNFSATYGEYSNDSFQGHGHQLADANGGQLSQDNQAGQAGSVITRDGATNPNSQTRYQTLNTQADSDGTPRTGTETAPASYAMIYCVKTAEDSAVSNSIWQTIGDLISPVNSSKDFVINTSDLYVDVSAGRVGIGTTSPSASLDITGNANGGSLYIRNGSSEGYASLVFANEGGNGILDVRNTTGVSAFHVNSTSGNVGIGTATPQNTLNVVGDLNVTGVSYLGNLILNADNVTLNNILPKNGLSIYINGSILPMVGFDNQFDLGRGDLRWKELFLGGNSYINGTYYGLGTGLTGTAAGLTAGTVTNGVYTNTANYVTLTDDSMADALHRHSELSASDGTPNPALSVDASGNVGIGTTSPTQKLDVAGRMRINATGDVPVIYFTDDDKTEYQVGQSVNKNGDWSVHETGQGARLLIQNTTGNVGIGTASPGYKLDVTDSVADWAARIINTDTTSGNGLLVRSDNAGAAQATFGVYANGAYRMWVQSDGNVGIGTTSPSYKLDVTGEIKASSQLIGLGGVYVGTITMPQLIDETSNGASSTTLYIGNAAIQVSSDKRLKDNITSTSINALDKLKQLEVVDFNWNDSSDTSFNNRNARGLWTGLIAQDTINVLPFVVNAPRKEDTLEIDYESNNTWQLEYQNMVPVLVKGIQELSAENDLIKQTLCDMGREEWC